MLFPKSKAGARLSSQTQRRFGCGGAKGEGLCGPQDTFRMAVTGSTIAQSLFKRRH